MNQRFVTLLVLGMAWVTCMPSMVAAQSLLAAPEQEAGSGLRVSFGFDNDGMKGVVRKVEQEASFKDAFMFGLHWRLRTVNDSTLQRWEGYMKEADEAIKKGWNYYMQTAAYDTLRKAFNVTKSAIKNGYWEKFFKIKQCDPKNPMRGLQDDDVRDCLLAHAGTYFRRGGTGKFYLRKKPVSASCYWTAKGWVSVRTFHAESTTESRYFKAKAKWRAEQALRSYKYCLDCSNGDELANRLRDYGDVKKKFMRKNLGGALIRPTVTWSTRSNKDVRVDKLP